MPTMAFELPSVAVLKEVIGGAGEVAIFLCLQECR